MQLLPGAYQEADNVGLFSAGGGDDKHQVGMVVFAIVLSLSVTLLIPIVAPSYDTDTGYTYADIYVEKANLESYTGQSMTNMTPWQLGGVFTPWNQSLEVKIDPETGWLYGESINYSRTGFSGQTTIGSTSGIYLDPNYKSNTPLYQADTTVTQIRGEHQWWAYKYGSDTELNLFGQIFDFFGMDLGQEEEVDVSYWTYTGYRYEFDPMLKIDWSDPSNPDYSTVAQSDAKLSIVWYEDVIGQGLSNGLILYNATTNGLVYNLELGEILANYNVNTGYSTKYALDFNGVNVYLNIRFDQDVMSGSVDLTQAFNEGRWTLAVTAKSMDNFMNISSSNSLSNSAANILDTYSQIFTLSLPEVPFLWSMVLWLICILPVDITILMFLSRFGIAGVGMGILGNVLLGVLGG